MKKVFDVIIGNYPVDSIMSDDGKTVEKEAQPYREEKRRVNVVATDVLDAIGKVVFQDGEFVESVVKVRDIHVE